MKKTKEDSELTRKNLLEIAFREFVETGIEESTLEGIASKAGVTRGALYWHFKDKYDLLESIIEYKDIESLKVMDELLSSAITPFDKLKKLIFLNFPDLPSPKKEKNYVRLKVELYNHFIKKGDKRKIGEYFLSACITLLTEAKKKGEINKGTDIKNTAYTILSILAGLFMRYDIFPDNKRSIKELKKVMNNYLNSLKN